MRNQVICLAIVLSVATCGGLLAEAEGMMSVIYNRLKGYANGGEADLNYDELVAAYKDFTENYTQEQIEELRRTEKGFRAFQDLILTPMSHWQPEDESREVKRAYTVRMAVTFRRFWPVYTSKELAGEGYIKNARHVFAFVLAVTGQNSETPTLAKWQMALKEYEAITQEIYVTVWHDDIYQDLDELELLMNFANDTRVRVTMGEFMDKLNACKSDAEIQTLARKIRQRIIEEQSSG